MSEAKRWRTLERENAALKRLVGARTRDHRMLQEVRETGEPGCQTRCRRDPAQTDG